MTAFSLYELNHLIRGVMEDSFSGVYWVQAELSEVRVCAKGHCFLELVEKGERGSVPIAKASAIIYGYLFPMLRRTFEDVTGQVLRAGLKVQLKVEVVFHELYGYSFVVKDIDPTYTLGSLAQLRKEILARLEADGVLELNKALSLPRPLQRIAVISSATAAGYDDFCNQIDNNEQGYAFRHKLFPAIMQGESVASSIMKALDDVYYDEDFWDAVVIIRGGGAVSDLAGFDNYDLAYVCAQYPLPLIVGIGHERDTTVLDFIANVRLKTPTAVAAFLIERMDKEAALIKELEAKIKSATDECLMRAKQEVATLAVSLNYAAKHYCSDREAELSVSYERISRQACSIIERRRTELAHTQQGMQTALQHYMQILHSSLDTYERAINHYNPENILKLGYSITRLNGRAVTDIKSVKPGDTLATQFAKGTAFSTVEHVDCKI